LGKLNGPGKLNIISRLKSSEKLNFFGKMNLLNLLRIKTKMMLLLAVVFIGFLLAIFMGITTVQTVKIGGKTYAKIINSKDSIEQIALLKSDLNQIRAEVIYYIDETEPDKMESIQNEMKKLIENINAKFDTIGKMMMSEEQKLAIQDGQATWHEFADTLQTEVIAAVQKGDRGKAREISNTVQKMRYERFIEQIGRRYA
jgi:methyl-accepting chemotaxis protein